MSNRCNCRQKDNKPAIKADFISRCDSEGLEPGFGPDRTGPGRYDACTQHRVIITQITYTLTDITV